MATETACNPRVRHGATAAIVIALTLVVAWACGYGHEESQQAFERASTLCERNGSLIERADALGGLAICLLNSGALDRGTEAATRVLEIGQQLNDEQLLLMAHEEIATIQHYQGKFAQSLAHAEAGSALYDPARPQARLVAARSGFEEGEGPAGRIGRMNCPSCDHQHRAGSKFCRVPNASGTVAGVALIKSLRRRPRLVTARRYE